MSANFRFKNNGVSWVKVSGVFFIASLLANTAQGAESLSHEAHQHGVAHMNVVQQGHKILIETRISGADIVGFEYQATSEKEQQQVAAAKQLLSNPQQMIKFSNAAQCNFMTASIETLQEDHEEHGDHEKHDDHEEHGDHEKHDDHEEHDDHEKHGDHEKHDDHEQHEDHEEHGDHEQHDDHEEHGDHDKHNDNDNHDDHEHAAEKSEHNEFVITYQAQCEVAKMSKQLTVLWFNYFPSIEKIQTQVVTDSSQSGKVLTKTDNRLPL